MEIVIKDCTFSVPLVTGLQHLSFEYVSTIFRRESSSYEPVFENVNMAIMPGTVNVFLGPCKGIKQLLRCISLKSQEGVFSGEILFNKDSRSIGHHKDIVFISKFPDMHFGSLSVFDFVLYSCQLRVSYDIIECRERSRHVLKLVGISGTSMVAILGKGEQRLLSIAIELISNPSLIVLNDPLGGLDSGSAIIVMHVLHSLSRRSSNPTTIVYDTKGIDRDMSKFIDNLALFDHRTLLWNGALGEYSDDGRQRIMDSISEMSVILKHFKDMTATNERNSIYLSLRKDVEKNILSAVKDIQEIPTRNMIFSGLTHSTSSRKVSSERNSETPGTDDGDWDTWPSESISSKTSTSSSFGIESSNERTFSYDQRRYFGSTLSRNSSQPAVNKSNILKAHDQINASLEFRCRKTILKEIQILVSRSFFHHIKYWIQIRMSIVRYLLAGLLIGAMSAYDGNHLDDNNLTTSNNGLVNSFAYNSTSVLFLIAVMSIIGTSFSVTYIFSSVHNLKREVEDGLYRTASGYIAMVLVDFLMYLIASILFGAAIISMLGIPSSLSINNFLSSYFSVVVLVSLSGYSLAALCAVWSSSQATSVHYFSLFGFFCIIFTGYLQHIQDLPFGWEWASSVVFTRFAFESLMLSLFQDVSDGESYLSTFNFSNGSIEVCIGLLLMWFFLLQVLFILGILPVSNKIKTLWRGNLHLFDIVLTGEPQSYDSNDIENRREFSISKHCDPFRNIPISSSEKSDILFQRLKFVNQVIGASGQESGDAVFQNVFGDFPAGSCACIIDVSPSGIVGRMLLQVLAGRGHQFGKVSGLLCVNGTRIGKNSKLRNSVYIGAGDVGNVDALTVKDAIRFSAILRCPHLVEKSTSSSLLSIFQAKEKSKGHSILDDQQIMSNTMHGISSSESGHRLLDELVDEILAIMGLEYLGDEIVGPHNDRPGLSPGQLRCLTIAVELVTRPSIIFIEDLTKALDVFDALLVAKAVNNLAKGHRTVLSTLSFPTDNIISYFSHMTLFSSSYMIYSGQLSKAPEYFESIGYEKKPFQNNVEFFLEIALDKGNMKFTHGKKGHLLSMGDLADMFRSLHGMGSVSSRNLMIGGKPSSNQDVSNEDGEDKLDINDNNSSIWHRTNVVITRTFRIFFADRLKVVIFLMKYMLAAIVLGTVFYNLKSGAYEERINLLASSFLFVNMVMIDVIEDIHVKKDAVYREIKAHMHEKVYFAEWLSDNSAIQFINLVGAFLFTIIVYPTSGLHRNVGHGLYFFLMIMAAIYCNIGLAYLVCSLSPSPFYSKLIFNGALVPLQFLTSGYLILIPTMASWINWCVYVNPMSYFMSGTMRSEFDGNSDALGTIQFSYLMDAYDFHASEALAFFVIAFIGALYRLAVLGVYWFNSSLQDKNTILAIQKSRRRARKIISSTLRWKNRDEINAFEQDTLPDFEVGSALHQSPQLASSGNAYSSNYYSILEAGPSSRPEAISSSLGEYHSDRHSEKSSISGSIGKISGEYAPEYADDSYVSL